MTTLIKDFVSQFNVLNIARQPAGMISAQLTVSRDEADRLSALFELNHDTEIVPEQAAIQIEDVESSQAGAADSASAQHSVNLTVTLRGVEEPSLAAWNEQTFAARLESILLAKLAHADLSPADPLCRLLGGWGGSRTAVDDYRALATKKKHLVQLAKAYPFGEKDSGSTSGSSVINEGDEVGCGDFCYGYSRDYNLSDDKEWAEALSNTEKQEVTIPTSSSGQLILGVRNEDVSYGLTVGDMLFLRFTLQWKNDNLGISEKTSLSSMTRGTLSQLLSHAIQVLPLNREQLTISPLYKLLSLWAVYVWAQEKSSSYAQHKPQQAKSSMMYAENTRQQEQAQPLNMLRLLVGHLRALSSEVLPDREALLFEAVTQASQLAADEKKAVQARSASASATSNQGALFSVMRLGDAQDAKNCAPDIKAQQALLVPVAKTPKGRDEKKVPQWYELSADEATRILLPGGDESEAVQLGHMYAYFCNPAASNSVRLIGEDANGKPQRLETSLPNELGIQLLVSGEDGGELVWSLAFYRQPSEVKVDTSAPSLEAVLWFLEWHVYPCEQYSKTNYPSAAELEAKETEFLKMLKEENYWPRSLYGQQHPDCPEAREVAKTNYEQCTKAKCRDVLCAEPNSEELDTSNEELDTINKESALGVSSAPMGTSCASSLKKDATASAGMGSMFSWMANTATTVVQTAANTGMSAAASVANSMLNSGDGNKAKKTQQQASASAAAGGGDAQEAVKQQQPQPAAAAPSATPPARL